MGVINVKAGKVANLPKFLDTLTLSQLRGGGGRDYTYSLALPRFKNFHD